MRRLSASLVFAAAVAVLTTLALAAPASSIIQIGAKGPNFTKSSLVGSSAGPPISLYDYAGKRVVVLFLLGYD